MMEKSETILLNHGLIRSERLIKDDWIIFDNECVKVLNLRIAPTNPNENILELRRFYADGGSATFRACVTRTELFPRIRLGSAVE